MNLKSAEVQSKDKRLFVQESKLAIDLNQVEKKLTGVWPRSLAEAQGQFTKADRDFSNGAVASRSLLTKPGPERQVRRMWLYSKNPPI
jgi:hypothetical protein